MFDLDRIEFVKKQKKQLTNHFFNTLWYKAFATMIFLELETKGFVGIHLACGTMVFRKEGSLFCLC